MNGTRRLIVIGASTGGLTALRRILPALPADLPAAILVTVHIGSRESSMPEILAAHCALPVRHARDREPITPGTVLIAPPDHHLMVEANHVRLSHGPKENFSRPAIDPLFRSAATDFGANLIGVVLTGALDDGTVGLQAVKAAGGIAIVQDPADADVPDMPRSALEHVAVDRCLPLARIADELIALVDRPALAKGPYALPESIPFENRFLLGKHPEMRELESVAAPSSLTCPECHGTLWEIKGSSPARFRCHVGHGFTARGLGFLQTQAVEDAIWAAVRALNEKENMLKRFAGMATDQRRRAEHEEAAGLARQNAQTLIAIISASNDGVGPT